MANQRSPLPYDYDTDRNSIARRQALADALVKQSITPEDGQMISGHYVAPGVGGAIKQIAAAYFGNKQQKDAELAGRDLATRYNTDKTKAMQDYQAAFEQDPRQAAIKGVASSFPELNKLAMEDAKNIPNTKDLLQYADPESIKGMVQGGGMQAFTPAIKLTNLTPGSVTVDQGGRVHNPTPLPGGDQGWGLVNIGGDTYQTSATGIAKKDQAPKTTNTTYIGGAVNKGESEFMKTMGKNHADMYKNAQDARLQAQKTMSVMDKLDSLNKAGTFSGKAANAANYTANLADTFGIPLSSADRNKLLNSQDYDAVLGRQVSSVLTAGSGVGRSMTDADREAFMSQFPVLANTPEGRQQISDTLRHFAQKDMQYAEGVNAQLKQAYPEAAGLIDAGGFPQDYNAGGQPPAAAAAAGQQPISLDDYLRMQQQ